jgi:hypothetical protein
MGVSRHVTRISVECFAPKDHLASINLLFHALVGVLHQQVAHTVPNVQDHFQNLTLSNFQNANDNHPEGVGEEHQHRRKEFPKGS